MKCPGKKFHDMRGETTLGGQMGSDGCRCYFEQGIKLQLFDPPFILINSLASDILLTELLRGTPDV